MPYQLFRTARIGTGAIRDPYRSALTRYIVADGTQDFWDWQNDARPMRYALALASESKLAECRADADIQAISPMLAGIPELEDLVEGEFTPDASTVGTLLESDGCSVSWAAPQTKRRAILKYLCKLHVVGQWMAREGNANAIAFLARNLNTTRAQLTTAQRNAIIAWLEARGLTASWTTASTTVRELIQYIIENLDLPVLRLGPLTL